MSRPTPLTRDDFPVFRSLQTRWSDNDLFGHMNNVVHYQLFDTAVNEWLIKLGLFDPHNSDIIGFVVETKCNYFSELAFPDRVAAGIRIDHLGTSSVRYGIALFREDEEIAAAQGHFIHVYVDRQTRKPAALNDTLRGVLEGIVHKLG